MALKFCIEMKNVCVNTNSLEDRSCHFFNLYSLQFLDVVLFVSGECDNAEEGLVKCKQGAVALYFLIVEVIFLGCFSKEYVEYFALG